MNKKIHFAINLDQPYSTRGRCGQDSKLHSRVTKDWAKVTCERCQNCYVRTSGVKPPFEKGEQERQPCLNESVLEVEVRTAWGEERMHPVNKAAKIFAAIAGTTTLTDRTLALAKKLGYKVVQPAKEY